MPATPTQAPSTDTAQFLSFPSPTPDDPSSSISPFSDPKHPTHESKKTKKTLLKDRLYIGNLHPTVDEYTLLTLFSKFGTITSLDFLFHKSGPSRGKPRGFAFVEFAEQAPAQKALQSLNDKLLRGRKLVVTYAHQAPPDPNLPSLSGFGVDRYGGGTGRRRGMMDVGKPTTLSLLKSGRGDGPNPKDKIALMEAKLRQMESSSPTSLPTSTANPTFSTPMSSINTASTSTLPHHPSLPLKPPPPTTSSPIHPDSKQKQKEKQQPVLPSLPILPSSQYPHPLSKPISKTVSTNSLSSTYTPAPTLTVSNAIPTPNSKSKPELSASGRPQAQVQGGPARREFGLAGVKIVRRDPVG